MISKNISIGLGSFSFFVLAYLYYVKRCYSYLKKYGYDSPPTKYFLGNLTDFLSKEHSINPDKDSKEAISHYSKTLRNWTRTYGKIYGYYEGIFIKNLTFKSY